MNEADVHPLRNQRGLALRHPAEQRQVARDDRVELGRGMVTIVGGFSTALALAGFALARRAPVDPSGENERLIN